MPGPPTPSTDPNPITPINPPKSLLSLPKELLTEVCSHLPQSDAISLLYVHRSLHQSAESRIYRDIKLSIPTYWGEPVLVRPKETPYGTNGYCNWAKKQALQVENAGRAEARRRVEELIKVLSRGEGRWRYVRKVVIEPRVGANNAIVQFLSLAREYVAEIEVIKSRDHIFRDQWQPKMSEMIWTKLLDFNISSEFGFSNLTTINIALEKHNCSSLPLALINLTKRLQYLKVTGGGANDSWICEEDECSCLAANTQARETTTRIDTVVLVGDLTDSGSASLLLGWLAARVYIRDLTLRIIRTGDEGLDWEDDWLPGIFCDGTIQRLDIRLGSVLLEGMLENVYCCNEDGRFLGTLIVDAPEVMESATERLDFVPMPTHSWLEHVKHLGLRTRKNLKASRIRKLRSDSSTNSGLMFRDDVHKTVAIAKDISLKLLSYPALDTIQFFDNDDFDAQFIPPHMWSATATHGVIIRSLHYKDSVLLHTRTLSKTRTRESPFDHINLPTAQWEDATDFEGHVVPLWVMSRMRAVDGGSKPWEGRGIQVGKKAWQVLLDWKKATHPDKVPEVAVGGTVAIAKKEPDTGNQDGVDDSVDEDEEDGQDSEEDSDNDSDDE